MTTFEKLQIRIKEDIGYDLEGFRRTYAGSNLKSGGAFVWVAKRKSDGRTVGSTISATNLLKQEKIEDLEKHGDALRTLEII